MAEAKHQEQEQDKSCEVCGVGDVDEACMLLCDGAGCEREFHTYCLTPSLHHIPPGDWYCPLCSEEGRAEELRRYFEEHEGMKKKMKTSGAYNGWIRRRKVAWRKRVEAEGCGSVRGSGGVSEWRSEGEREGEGEGKPEFTEGDELIGQLVLLHTDVNQVHTGRSSATLPLCYSVTQPLYYCNVVPWVSATLNLCSCP
jgi:hypothetical protein